jgi:3-oxoacyl-[acyl-carrier protein] reductase
MTMRGEQLALGGRVALLTGASGGIGKGIGRALADEGVDLFLTYGRHGDDAEDVATYVRELGRRVVVASADLADPSAPARLAEQANSELGQVDILVANAGTATVKGWETAPHRCPYPSGASAARRRSRTWQLPCCATVI